MGTMTTGGRTALYATPAGPNVTTADTEIVAANRSRTMLVMVNDSDTDVYLAIDGETAVVNRGIRLNTAGGAVQFGGSSGVPLTTGAIRAIHAGTGNKVLTVQESS